jgi:hypothetical protein
MRQWDGALRAAVLLAACSFSAAGLGQSKLAPGFAKLPAGATVIVMPIDIELFELSVGGVPAPRADWTKEAGERIRQSYLARKQGRMQMADMQDDPQLVELNRLHEAVAASILVHHFNPKQGLRAKYGRLDWSLGPDAARLGEKTGADYALFTVVRDAYASGARQALEVFNTAAMIALALTGRVIVTPGNSNVTRAHASLVELKTGRIVWANRLTDRPGDLRDADAAKDTVEALLADFPK